jgi:hypothetical protein
MAMEWSLIATQMTRMPNAEIVMSVMAVARKHTWTHMSPSQTPKTITLKPQDLPTNENLYFCASHA